MAQQFDRDDVPEPLRWLDRVGRDHSEAVGTKSAWLGECGRIDGGDGPQIPRGFTITVDTFHRVLRHNGLSDRALDAERDGDAAELQHLAEALLTAELPDTLRDAITTALSRLGDDGTPLAVRSSSTVEDLREASFAGEYATVLGVRGATQVFDAYRTCLASLFRPAATARRRALAGSQVVGSQVAQLAATAAPAMAVSVQRLVRSDAGVAGVMFTRDPDDPGAGDVLIDAAFGLGDAVVGGIVDPERYRCTRSVGDGAAIEGLRLDGLGAQRHRSVLSTSTMGSVLSELNDLGPDEADRGPALPLDDIGLLARWGIAIEQHFGLPMDVEWALDGISGELVVTQARPLAVHPHAGSGAEPNAQPSEEGHDGESVVLATGVAVGLGNASGPVIVIDDLADPVEFEPGAVLVTRYTDPSWLPLMQVAGALVTDHGGRLSHAAVVARELGLLAVVGCGDATTALAGAGTVVVHCDGELGTVQQG